MIGSLVATLPVSAGPAFVFLSLDQGPPFIAAAALAGFVATIGTILFATVYAIVAQRQRMIISLLCAHATWLTFAFGSRFFDWTLGRATLLAIVVFSAAIVLTRPAASRADAAAEAPLV